MDRDIVGRDPHRDVTFKAISHHRCQVLGCFWQHHRLEAASVSPASNAFCGGLVPLPQVTLSKVLSYTQLISLSLKLPLFSFDSTPKATQNVSVPCLK